MISTEERELFSDDDEPEGVADHNKVREFLFVRDIHSSGSKSEPFTSMDDKIFTKDFHLHERIEGNCIPYGDYDELFPLNRPSDDYIKSTRACIKNVVEQCFPGATVIMGDRSGYSKKHSCYKLSIRFWVRGAGFYESTRHCGQDVLAKINPLLKIVGIKQLDKGVYKKNQNLGVVFNSKMGDPRVLKITTPEIDPILTLVQNTENEEYIEIMLNEEKGIVRQCEGLIEQVFKAAKKLMPGILYDSHKGSDVVYISFKKSIDDCPIHKCMHKSNRAFAVWFENTGYAYLKCHHDTSTKISLGRFGKETSEFKRVFDDKDFSNCFREDQGLAEIFSRYHKDSIKIIDASGDGYIYNPDNALWEEHESIDIMNRLSPFLERVCKECLFVESKRCEGLDVSEAKLIIPFKKIIRSVLTSSKSKSIYSKVKTMLRAERDFRDRLNSIKHLFPIRGGKVVDLKKGVIIERKQEHMFSFECDVDLIEDISFADNFMNQICCERKNLLDYLQKSLGTCLTGETHRKFYFWYGDGINGKTTITGCMNNFMKSYCKYVKKSLVIKTGKGNKEGSSHDSDLMEIQGLRVGFAKELDKNDELNSARIKALADGSVIKARAAYSKDEVSIIPTLTQITETNWKPNVDTSDKAILDRVVYIPFDARFVEAPTKPNEYLIDKTVKEKLLEDSKERNSFFSWLVKGAVKYYTEGFYECKTLVDSMSSSLLEVDKLQQFIEECCIIDGEMNVKANKFYDDYRYWMLEEHNERIEISKRQLTQEIKKKGFALRRSNGTIYCGLDMKRKESDYEFH